MPGSEKPLPTRPLLESQAPGLGWAGNGNDWSDVSAIKGKISDPVWSAQFPLTTRGRQILNTRGERFRLKGVNWYGASDVLHVVGGLDVQSLEVICRTVHDLGFNVVRLPYSNEMLRCSLVPEGSVDYRKNPSLRGLSALQVYDEVVKCLGRNRVAVIVNNHTTYGEFCGPPSRNSLWFEPQGPFTEEQWLQDWVMMARRYARCPHVVGFDLRNEIRPRLSQWPAFRGSAAGPLAGGGNWARAAVEAARRIQRVNPQALIVVERIVWPQRGLADYAACPGPLLPELAGRLVLGVHLYNWSGPGRFIPNWSIPPQWSWAMRLLRAAGIITPKNYGDLTREELQQQVREEFGHVLEADICPVWVSEFGANDSAPEEMSWLEDFVPILAELDADWAYWPLNVGPKPGCGAEDIEAYGMISAKWIPKVGGDPRLRLLEKIGLKAADGAVFDVDAEPVPLSRPCSRTLMAGKDPLQGVRKSKAELRDMVLSLPPLAPLRGNFLQRLRRTRSDVGGPLSFAAEYAGLKKAPQTSSLPSVLLPRAGGDDALDYRPCSPIREQGSFPPSPAGTPMARSPARGQPGSPLGGSPLARSPGRFGQPEAGTGFDFV